ncbi:MAG: hypothetical protein KME32_30235 [Mojavia pulchra JT2-VF2]|jgi:hypothetical protein|uniref:Uncharacterized protein n=1 Tax=Mojavia pulchra JT2-VF2 TaxID=287848 RepID=A0A951UJP5_9NOST|nr:hypothetical protein [Mojavia pulchra JT2-VF2]
MTADQSQPLIDFSNAKEPPRSLNLDQQEAPPIEPEEVSGQIKQDPLPDDFNRQPETVGERQMIVANIPGAPTNLNDAHD